MNETVDYKNYLDILRDPAYIELYNYYSRETMMGILGVSRQENPHSGFLRWLLDVHGEHGYGDMAMRKFLETICLFHDKVYGNASEHKEEVENALWQREGNLLWEGNKDKLDEIRYGRYEIVHQDIANEIVLKNQRRADIFAVLELKMQRKSEAKFLILLIENKVHSQEHNEQTVSYVKDVNNEETLGKALDSMESSWIDEEKKADILKDSLQLYVFLNAYPTKEIKDALNRKKYQPQFARSEDFITVNYQYLLDGMIEPLSNLTDDAEIKQRMNEYIRCLGQAKIASIEENNSNNSKKNDEYLIMAVSRHEKELAISLWKKYYRIIYSILESHFYEGEFLLNENDRDFWISYSNLFRLIEEKELTGEVACNPADCAGEYHKYCEYMKTLIQSANTASRKHRFCFRGEFYESYNQKGKSIGALCRDIIFDLIKHKEKEKEVTVQWIEKFRGVIQTWNLNWLQEVILLDDEVERIRKNDGSYQPSCKYYTKEESEVRKMFFDPVRLDIGHQVYIARFWGISDMKNLIDFIDREYSCQYKEEVEQEY